MKLNKYINIFVFIICTIFMYNIVVYFSELDFSIYTYWQLWAFACVKIALAGYGLYKIVLQTGVIQ